MKGPTQVAVGFGVVGLVPDRGAVFGDGPVELALARQGVSQVVVGLGEVGLVPDCGAEFGDGLVELALVPQGEAEVVVGDGVVGLVPDCGAEFGDGFIELAQIRQGFAETEVGLNVVGLEPDRLAPGGHRGFERLDGFPGQPLRLERRAQTGEMPGIAGSQLLEVSEDGDASSESPRDSRAWASSWAVSGRIARAAV